LKNTVYTFGTLFHCFNDHSILSELKMSSFGPYACWREDALSINCAIKCTSFVEGRATCQSVPQRRELVTGTRAAGQGSK